MKTKKHKISYLKIFIMFSVLIGIFYAVTGIEITGKSFGHLHEQTLASDCKEATEYLKKSMDNDGKINIAERHKVLNLLSICDKENVKKEIIESSKKLKG